MMEMATVIYVAESRQEECNEDVEYDNNRTSTAKNCLKLGRKSRSCKQSGWC